MKVFLLFLTTLASAQAYVISTLAGADLPDHVPAASAYIGSPRAVVVDADDNVLFTSFNILYKLDRIGILTRLAGTGRERAWFEGLATDGAGNVYVVDVSSGAVRKVSTSGVLSTVASSNGTGYVAVDEAGRIYVPDANRVGVDRFGPGGGTTVAGGYCLQPGSCLAGDGGLATGAKVGAVTGLAADHEGNFYFLETEARRIRKVSSRGIITTVASNVCRGLPNSLSMDRSGNFYFAEPEARRVWRASSGGAITLVAGNGTAGFSGDGGRASEAQLNDPRGAAVDSAGNIYIADGQNDRIRKVSAAGTITTVAGIGPDGYPAAKRRVETGSLAADLEGNVYFWEANQIREISRDGIVSTVPKTGDDIQVLTGTGKIVSVPRKSFPSGAPLAPQSTAIDGEGNLYFASFWCTYGGYDRYDDRILKLSAAGFVSTFAARVGMVPPFDGPGESDGAMVLLPYLSGGPVSIALDRSGNLYVADGETGAVYRISSRGAITNIVARGGLKSPMGIALDDGGNLYISEYGANRVVKISPVGVISAIAGTGDMGFSGDGGPAMQARFQGPGPIAMDKAGNLYVLDLGNHAIRVLHPSGIAAGAAKR